MGRRTVNEEPMNLSRMCRAINLTFLGAEPDGTTLWECNHCQQIVRVTPLMTVTAQVFLYAHQKPEREQIEIPEAFRKAFE
jgi:hypothetical protein